MAERNTVRRLVEEAQPLDIKFSQKLYRMWPPRRKLADGPQFRPTLLLQRIGDDAMAAHVCNHGRDQLMADFWLETFPHWRHVAEECLMKWNICDIYKQEVVERITWQPGWNLKIYWAPIIASWVTLDNEVYRFRGYNKNCIDLDDGIYTEKGTSKRLATEEEIEANLRAVAIVKAMEIRKFTRHKQSNRGDFLAMHLPRDRKGFMVDDLETQMAMIMHAYLTTHPQLAPSKGR